jgi:hypothetical protein
MAGMAWKVLRSSTTFVCVDVSLRGIDSDCAAVTGAVLPISDLFQ